MPQPGQPADASPLNGWKEIAAYLGRSVRSVQRYEHELGLPIHRLTHADGQTVYAFRHEIDGWRATLDHQRHLPEDQPDPEPPAPAGPGPGAPPRRRLAIWGTLGLALAVALGLVVRWALSRRGDIAIPTAFTLVGRALEARDGSGRLMWKHDFGADVSSIGDLQHGNWTMADVDDDGTLEIIVAVRFAAAGQPASRSDALFAFSAAGDPRWSVTAPERLVCRTETFSAPWRIHAMAVSAGPGPRKTWAAFNHHTWWPGLVLEVDPDGGHRLRYVQTGWARTLATWTTASGAHLAVGGVDNQVDRPTVALVDLAKPPARTPAALGRFSCDGLPSAPPSARFLFQNPEMIAARGQAYAFVDRLEAMGHVLKASINAGGGAAIVHLNADSTVADASFSDPFWVLHREFEREGRIRHSAERCPERVQQTIRRWMPDTGWQDFKVTPTIRTALASER